MKCFQAEKLLLRYHRSELEEPKASLLREHLSHCSQCCARLAEYEQISEALMESSASFPVQEPNPALWDQLEAQLSTTTPSPLKTPWWQNNLRLRVVALAACTIGLGVILGSQFYLLNRDARQTTCDATLRQLAAPGGMGAVPRGTLKQAPAAANSKSLAANNLKQTGSALKLYQSQEKIAAAPKLEVKKKTNSISSPDNTKMTQPDEPAVAEQAPGSVMMAKIPEPVQIEDQSKPVGTRSAVIDNSHTGMGNSLPEQPVAKFRDSSNIIVRDTTGATAAKKSMETGDRLFAISAKKEDPERTAVADNRVVIPRYATRPNPRFQVMGSNMQAGSLRLKATIESQTFSAKDPIQVSVILTNETPYPTLPPSQLVIQVHADGNYGPAQSYTIPIRDGGLVREKDENQVKSRFVNPGTSKEYSLDLRQINSSIWQRGSYRIQIEAEGNNTRWKAQTPIHITLK